MGDIDSSGHSVRTPIGLRVSAHALWSLPRTLTRAGLRAELLAGITLLAIAIPEQLATSRLADVPAFTAMIAFMAATLAFTLFGSNPIMSVGADSTIAPLFAVALVRLAPGNSTHYLELVAVSAVVTGVGVALVGLFRLGWIADFLSLPIVAGFLGGIGLIIIVHQLPSALGIASGGTSIVSRLHVIESELANVHVAAVGLSLSTLVLMMVGERWNARLPWALLAIALATAAAQLFTLSAHGVAQLGAVSAGLPTWRLRWLDLHEWGVVVTTALTLTIVVLSQSAATARASADELGVADDLSRDFVGVGLANIAAGLVGAFPVDASPARTTVARLAGGRTRLVGLVAVVGALVLSPLAHFASAIPLAALAGVLFFVAGRLVKLSQFRAVWRASRLEFALAMISFLGVIVFGVELGLGIAVGLAVLNQTWRSSRPHLIELGRRKGTTSWEPLGSPGVERVKGLVVVLFDQEIFFANAGAFRRLLHQLLARHPRTEHLVLDAVAVSDVDFTATVMLAQVFADLGRDEVSISLARANELVQRHLETSSSLVLRHVAFFDSVDAAASAATKRN
ncbi:MAG TPA: SulP family inorganic anion transporter [Acidimicrobiales bacterium]|nr:MAG: hypothetical protein B7X07_00450 [Actinobacteria bacterium 21-64-8]HQT98879.1 SulP family inorganic anion transporter [Acidimicrobiales bacterium]